ncbi:MAG: ribulose-phosphate 3-epimerase [Nitrospirota bacterium]|nr:ribulose-phosphate 3-epimerase [Nitrospirota bacterium]
MFTKDHKLIAPSILSADFARLAEEVAAVEAAGADVIHVDVMDGHFVPNLTIGPVVVEWLRKVTRLPLDCHLMITDPDRYIGEFVAAGADCITVHQEACPHLHRTVQLIREEGAKAGRKVMTGVSINPATPVETLSEILPDCDLVLIMSVNPGFGGQKFIPGALDKVRRLRRMVDERRLSTYIEIDGGIKADNIAQVAKAGVDVFVAGSAVFNADDYGASIGALKAAV